MGMIEILMKICKVQKASGAILHYQVSFYRVRNRDKRWLLIARKLHEWGSIW